MLGSIAKEIKLENENNVVKINVGDLADGIYFYSLVIDDKIYKTKKLIVNK
jgi:hypothetical protein